MINVNKAKMIYLFLMAGILFSPVCIFAGTEFLKTTISDIQNNPDLFYDKDVEAQAYFFKTDDIWVKSLKEPNRYIGVFISKPEKGASPFLGEYFGFIFAPQEMEPQIRLLRMGDKITIRGKCFNFQSTSINGPGIKASELLMGWGNGVKPLSASLPVTKEEVVSLIQANNNAALPAVALSVASEAAPSSTVKAEAQKYNLYLNGKGYQGLTFGDEYSFEGIRFRVEKARQGSSSGQE